MGHVLEPGTGDKATCEKAAADLAKRSGFSGRGTDARQYHATIRPVLTYDPDAAVAHLRQTDQTLAHVIDTIGPFTLEPRDGIFRSLARAIFFQQLAGPAARAIMNRTLEALGTDERRYFTPQEFLTAGDEALRSAGLSRQKMSYLRDLADKFASGELSEDEFASLDDQGVIARASSARKPYCILS